MALERLKKLGYSGPDAKKLIWQCVCEELFDVIKNDRPFELNRYVRNLNNLPAPPFDDEGQ